MSAIWPLPPQNGAPAPNNADGPMGGCAPNLDAARAGGGGIARCQSWVPIINPNDSYCLARAIVAGLQDRRRRLLHQPNAQFRLWCETQRGDAGRELAEELLTLAHVPLDLPEYGLPHVRRIQRWLNDQLGGPQHVRLICLERERGWRVAWKSPERAHFNLCLACVNHHWSYIQLPEQLLRVGFLGGWEQKTCCRPKNGVQTVNAVWAGIVTRMDAGQFVICACVLALATHVNGSFPNSAQIVDLFSHRMTVCWHIDGGWIPYHRAGRMIVAGDAPISPSANSDNSAPSAMPFVGQPGPHIVAPSPNPNNNNLWHNQVFFFCFFSINHKLRGAHPMGGRQCGATTAATAATTRPLREMWRSSCPNEHGALFCPARSIPKAT